MPALIFDLDISADQILAYYRGDIRAVRARATNGTTVEFPASALRRHVSTDGIHGRFWMEFDRQNKFVSLERVAN